MKQFIAVKHIYKKGGVMKQFARHIEQGKWKGCWQITRIEVGCYNYANGVKIDVIIALDASLPYKFAPSPRTVL